MIKIKPFKALRPPRDIVKEVAARPYDVLNSQEAQAEAGEKSLLHITKPEIDFSPIIDEHSRQAYEKAAENFRKWQKRGWLNPDQQERYYIYAQTMEGRTQYGLTACTHIDDYLDGRIKKHELTRKDKEEDRMLHVRIQDANIEPVFLAYPDVEEMNLIVESVVKNQTPEYDFIADDGFGHSFWIVNDDSLTQRITEIFAQIPALYVADGHHRTAAAALVGSEKRAKNPAHTGNEEYNWFMAVIFPESQLKIIDYNRIVKDLNGLTPDKFVEKLRENFVIERKPCIAPYKPSKLHNFAMYLNGDWYSLTAKPEAYDDSDPIGTLDVTVLSSLVFDKILDIGDLRTSTRIDFVGGIRALEKRSSRRPE